MDLPAEIEQAIECYVDLDETATVAEVRATVAAAVASLHSLTEASTDCTVVFYAHAMIVQILSRHTHESATMQVQQLLWHASRAIEVGGSCGHVPSHSVDIARSLHGAWSSKVANRLSEDEAEPVRQQSEAHLRKVLADAEPGTRTYLMRRFNLGVFLLQDGSETASLEALDLLGGAADDCSALDPHNVADYLHQFGNALRRAAHLVPHEEAEGLRVRALAEYERAAKAGSDRAIDSEVALLLHEMGASLDEVIGRAEAGFAGTMPDDPHWREAALQLAEYYCERYKLAANPGDADRADELSLEAVASFYAEPGSVEQRRHLKRRLLILENTASRTGNRLDRYEEMLDIVRRLGLREATGVTSLQRSTTTSASLIEYSLGEKDLVTLVEILTEHIRMSRFAANARDGARDVAEAVSLLASAISRAAFLDDDISLLKPVIADAHRAASQVAGEIAADELKSRFHLAQARADLSLHEGAAFSDGGAIANAQGFVALAVELGDALCLAPPTMIPVFSLMHSVATFNSNSELGLEAARRLREQISDFDDQVAVNRTPESAVLRERLVAPSIGPASLSTESPEDLAWTMANMRSLGGVGDRDRWIRVVEEASHQTTVVFVAQSIVTCRAAVVSNGAWIQLDLPGGAATKFREPVRAMASAHESEVSIGDRRQLLARIFELTCLALAPLTDHLVDGRLVQLFETGIMQFLPAAAALLELKKDLPSVVVIESAALPVHLGADITNKVAVLVDASSGTSYLDSAVEDGERIASALGVGAVLIEPNKEEVIAALTAASSAFLIAHGKAEVRQPLDSLIDLGRGISVKDILDLDLSNLRVAVLPNCESLSFDADVAEARLGPSTALLARGVIAVVDCRWRVAESVASEFTRRLADGLAAGDSLTQAAAAAIRGVPFARDHFQLRFGGLLAHSAEEPSDVFISDHAGR